MRVWECQTRRCAAPRSTDRLDMGAAVGGIRTSATLSRPVSLALRGLLLDPVAPAFHGNFLCVVIWNTSLASLRTVRLCEYGTAVPTSARLVTVLSALQLHMASS